MIPVLGTRRGIFLTLRTKYDSVKRSILFIGRSLFYVDPVEYLLFDSTERRRNISLSPEHRAYLGQLHRNQNDSSLASKRIPFCDAKLGDSAPRWKIAILTWIRVCFKVGALNLLIGPWMASWSRFTNLLIFNAAVVLVLTWLVMPVLTWFAQVWLKS